MHTMRLSWSTTMVRRISYILLISLWFLVPGQLFALGLGEINVDSALNQPLEARINLISARTDELEEMRIELAPADVFDRVGVPRPYFLTQLKFEPISLPGGRLAIRVTSKDPVREPFLTFLVEVTWPKGRLLREYTVLLDPPEFAQQRAPQVTTPLVSQTPTTDEVVKEEVVVSEITTQPSVNTSASAEDLEDIEAVRARLDQELGIDHSEPVAASEEIVDAEPAAEEIEEAVEIETQTEEIVAEDDVIVAEEIEVADVEPIDEIDSNAISGGDYTTVKGDTLYSISKNASNSTEVSIAQMMLAIQQANPSAFIRDNINHLKTGEVLRIPDASDVRGISKEAAKAEVIRQNSLWREYQSQLAENMPAVNVDAPDLVEDATEASEGLTAEAEEVLKGSVEETAKSKQDLNIMAGDEASTQSANSEQITKLQKEQVLLKELVQSRDKENEDLKSRVEALESMLEKKDKIISIQNEQLSSLKQQLDNETSKAIEAEKLLTEKQTSQANELKEEASEQAKVEEIKSPIVEPLPDFDDMSKEAEQTIAKPKLEPLPDWDSLPKIESEELVVAETSPTEEQVEQPAETTQTASQDEKSVETEPATALEEEVQQRSPGFFDIVKGIAQSIRENSGIGAAALAIVAVLLGLFAWRQKRSTKRIETMQMGMPEPLEDDKFDDILDETIVTPTKAPVEEAEPDEEPVFASSAKDDLEVDVTDVEDTDLAEALAADASATPDEVLEEADVYISYGLHQQAQDLLNDAIAAEPSRNDYKVKLAEVLYSAKDQDAFEKHAQTIKDQLGEASKDWQSVAAMGKEIAPNNALFAGAVAGVVATKAVEKPEATDIDVGSQTVINESSDNEALEDTVLDESSVGDEGLDFNIDEQVTESFDDDPVASKIMEANETSDILNFDIDDLSDGELEEQPDTDDDLEAVATGLHKATGIHEALDMDEEGDLTEELGDLTEELEEVGLQTTMDDLEPIDEALVKNLDTTVALQTDGEFDLDMDASTNTTVDDPDATTAYMSSGLQEDTTTVDDPDATTAYMPGDLDQDATEQFDPSNLDTEFLDPAEDTIAQTSTDLQELGPPSLIEEVGTKLDLAKAFVDMGDSDAAKETLLEVINEGDESQIKAAKDLMDKLG